jgi:hypothetical protein
MTMSLQRNQISVHQTTITALLLLLLLPLAIRVVSAEDAANRRLEANRKPQIDDTIRATVYADNWFSLFINGELVAIDSIAFLPHNVIAVDLLPVYPMTIAVIAKDNADPATGMEYANTQIGDGGFILRFGDGTVTDRHWKALVLEHGPIDGDTQNPRVRSQPPPAGWQTSDFDDRDWPQATEYTLEQVQPKQTFYDHDFSGAQFIWSDNLLLDNTVLFRRQITTPPDGRQRPDFSGLNDRVPNAPAGRKKPGPKKPRRRPEATP